MLKFAMKSLAAFFLLSAGSLASACYDPDGFSSGAVFRNDKGAYVGTAFTKFEKRGEQEVFNTYVVLVSGSKEENLSVSLKAGPKDSKIRDFLLQGKGLGLFWTQDFEIPQRGSLTLSVGKEGTEKVLQYTVKLESKRCL